jgi:hypothetical protein
MAMFTVAVQGFGPVRAHGDRLRGGRILPDEPVVTSDGKLHDTLIQVHSGAGAPNEVSAIQILDVLLWMAFRKR